MIINVKVYTRKENKVIKNGNFFDIYVNKAPVQGKANKEIIKILAKYFKIKANQVFLISGEKSKNKKFEIQKD